MQNVHEVNGVGTVNGGFGGEIVVQCPMPGGFGP